MTREHIETRLKKVFSEYFGPEALDRAGDDTKLFYNHGEEPTQAGLDSLDKIELLMAVEEEFGIDIDDVSEELIRTFGDIVNAVETRVTGPKFGAN